MIIFFYFNKEGFVKGLIPSTILSLLILLRLIHGWKIYSPSPPILCISGNCSRWSQSGGPILIGNADFFYLLWTVVTFVEHISVVFFADLLIERYETFRSSCKPRWKLQPSMQHSPHHVDLFKTSTMHHLPPISTWQLTACTRFSWPPVNLSRTYYYQFFWPPENLSRTYYYQFFFNLVIWRCKTVTLSCTPIPKYAP